MRAPWPTGAGNGLAGLLGAMVCWLALQNGFGREAASGHGPTFAPPPDGVQTTVVKPGRPIKPTSERKVSVVPARSSLRKACLRRRQLGVRHCGLRPVLAKRLPQLSIRARRTGFAQLM